MSASTSVIERTEVSQRSWWLSAMTRAAWLQHRSTLMGLLVLFVVGAVAIVHGELDLHPLYATYLSAGCTGGPVASVTCANSSNFVASNNDGFALLDTTLRALPVVVGLFVGAPLLSRDLESGTYRFAWTQGVGRVRYVLSSLLILAAVVALISAVLGLLLGGWYAHDINVMNPNVDNHWQFGFYTTWFMLSAWTLFALGLGALLGATLKRLVASMLLTAIIVGGIVVASSIYLDRLLRIGALVMAMPGPIRGVNAGTLDFVRQGHPSIWLLQGWITGPKGQVLGNAAVNHVENLALVTKDPNRWLSLHHDTFWVAFQTAGRFWMYQGALGAILIALAVVCGVATLRVVRAARG